MRNRSKLMCLKSRRKIFRLKRNSLREIFRDKTLTKRMDLAKRANKWTNLTRIKWRMKV